jgi:cyclohexanone monooxygenase
MSSITLEVDIVMLASGPFSGPSALEFPNLERYQGDIFQTSRWNYDINGGLTESPELDKLKDKTVGIIGTGALSIQVAPNSRRGQKN